MTSSLDDVYPYPVPRDRPRPWVTWFLLGSTVTVFLLQLAVLHLTGEDQVGDQLAFSRAAWSDGRYWTLLSYAWVHAVAIFGEPGLFWLHIVANMIPLYCLGPALEDFLGRGRFLGLYIGGALAAALAWIALNPESSEPIIGASGAVFALIAGAGTAAPRERVTVLLFFILPLSMNLRTLAIVLCALEAAQALFGWMPEVAHSAHLGGAAFGFVYVALLRGISRWWPFP